MPYPFRYIGFDVLEPAIFHGVGGVASIEGKEDGLSDIDRHINQWGDMLDSLENRKITPFNQDSDFDESKRLVSNASVYSPFISHQSNTPWD